MNSGRIILGVKLLPGGSLFCLTVLLVKLVAARAADAAPSQPADQFKEFISNPPIIADLVYERQKPGQPVKFIRVRWQKNGEFLQIGNATNLEAFLNDTNPVRSSFGLEARYDNIYWHVAGSMLEVTTNDGGQGTIVKSVGGMDDLFIGTVLTFGMEQRLRGSVRWAGDAFTFTSADKDVQATGTMTRDELGRAQTLALTTRSLKEKYAFKFVCKYFYDEPLPLSYLPSRIERQLADGYEESQETLSKQTIIIHTLTIASAPLPETAFSLQSLMSSPDIDHIVTTSNEFNIMYKKGEASPRMFRDLSAAELRRPSYQMAYFVIAICLFLIPFLIFLFSRPGRRRDDL